MDKQAGTDNHPFRGFRSPNTTPIPDELFDELLADLSGAEVKVLLYICRRTFGWKKDNDNISLNQMLQGITRKDGTKLDHGVGLSKPTLLRTIRSLTEKNILIVEQRESKEKGYEPTNYRLNVIDVREPLGKKMILGESQNFTKPLVKKSYPQETYRQETVYKTVNGDDSIFKKLPLLDQPKDKTQYVAECIMDELKDTQSERFYNLIAARVPEEVIWQALSEIKVDGADDPPKLFTHKIKIYAVRKLKQKLTEREE